MVSNSPEDPSIFCDGTNITLERSDESLLGLLTPAPIDSVANRALDYLERFKQQWYTAIDTEVQYKLGLHNDISRLKQIGEVAGVLSLHNWLNDNEQ